MVDDDIVEIAKADPEPLPRTVYDPVEALLTSDLEFARLAEYLSQVRDGSEITAKDWPPLARLLATPQFASLLACIGSGHIIGSFAPAILQSPLFLSLYGVDRTGQALDINRCSDLDIMTVEPLDTIANRLTAAGYQIRFVRQDRPAWAGAGELNYAPNLRVSLGNLEISTIFQIRDPAVVDGWLATRAFYDETVALSFSSLQEQPVDRVSVVDPGHNLGPTYRRAPQPTSLYVPPIAEAISYDTATKLAKVAARFAELGHTMLYEETVTYIRTLFTSFYTTRQEMEPEIRQKLMAKIAGSVARCFATEPLIAAHLLLINNTPIMGLFSPTLAENVGWNLTTAELNCHDIYARRHQQIIDRLITRYGSVYYVNPDRMSARYNLSTPDAYPDSLHEVIDEILAALQLPDETNTRIKGELMANWPAGLTHLPPRWRSRFDGVDDFDPSPVARSKS